MPVQNIKKSFNCIFTGHILYLINHINSSVKTVGYLVLFVSAVLFVVQILTCHFLSHRHRTYMHVNSQLTVGCYLCGVQVQLFNGSDEPAVLVSASS